jgi:hypothetical protein
MLRIILSKIKNLHECEIIIVFTLIGITIMIVTTILHPQPVTNINYCKNINLQKKF